MRITNLLLISTILVVLAATVSASSTYYQYQNDYQRTGRSSLIGHFPNSSVITHTSVLPVGYYNDVHPLMFHYNGIGIFIGWDNVNLNYELYDYANKSYQNMTSHNYTSPPHMVSYQGEEYLLGLENDTGYVYTYNGTGFVELNSQSLSGGNTISAMGSEIVCDPNNSSQCYFIADGVKLCRWDIVTGSSITCVAGPKGGTRVRKFVPAIGNIDTDANLEIVTNYGSLSLAVWEIPSMTLDTGFDSDGLLNSSGKVCSGPTLYDWDGDNDLDIIYPCSDNPLKNAYYGWYYRSAIRFRIFDGDGTEVYAGYLTDTNQYSGTYSTVPSMASICHVDNDDWICAMSDGGPNHAWGCINSSGQRAVFKWAPTTAAGYGANIDGHFCMDIDNDGDDEFLIGSRVYKWDGGTSITASLMFDTNPDDSDRYYSLYPVDVDLDGRAELVQASRSRTQIFFETYNEPCYPDWNCTGYGSCTIADEAACNAVTDLNTCGVSYEGSYSEFIYQPCDYCIPSWSCSSYDPCISGFTNCTAVSDSNTCYAQTGLSADNYTGNYSEFQLTCSTLDTSSDTSSVGRGEVKYCQGAVCSTDINYFLKKSEGTSYLGWLPVPKDNNERNIYIAIAVLVLGIIAWYYRIGPFKPKRRGKRR